MLIIKCSLKPTRILRTCTHKGKHFYIQNKQQLSGVWRELAPGDSQAGQLLQHMLGVQLKQLRKVVKSGILRSLRPFSGLFVDGDMVMVMSKL